MKTINKFKNVAIALLFISITSCSSDDDNNIAELELTENESIEEKAIITSKIENLSAPQSGGQGQPISGEFTKFDFKTGTETTSETEWDIAFRGTTIAVNGGTSTGTTDEPERNGNAGVAIVSGTFDNITTANNLTFKQDSPETSFAIPTGSDNGWYNYNFVTNVVSSIPGTIIVLKTRDGKYAKIEILSYYLNLDSTDAAGSRHYTFNYSYNPNEGETSI